MKIQNKVTVENIPKQFWALLIFFLFGFAILTGGAVHEKGLIAQDCKF